MYSHRKLRKCGHDFNNQESKESAAECQRISRPGPIIALSVNQPYAESAAACGCSLITPSIDIFNLLMCNILYIMDECEEKIHEDELKFPRMEVKP